MAGGQIIFKSGGDIDVFPFNSRVGGTHGGGSGIKDRRVIIFRTQGGAVIHVFYQEIATDGVGTAGDLVLVEAEEDGTDSFTGQGSRDIETDKTPHGEINVSADTDFSGIVAAVVAGPETIQVGSGGLDDGDRGGGGRGHHHRRLRRADRGGGGKFGSRSGFDSRLRSR